MDGGASVTESSGTGAWTGTWAGFSLIVEGVGSIVDSEQPASASRAKKRTAVRVAIRGEWRNFVSIFDVAKDGPTVGLGA